MYCDNLLHYYCDDERIMAISGDNFRDGNKRTPIAIIGNLLYKGSKYLEIYLCM